MIGEKKIIQEFKKSLWHDASEEPKGNSECIINTRLGYYKRCWNAIDKCWDDEEGYDHFCEMFEVKRWMYLNDILPKEGGEQC